jgi:hypothetical protein
MAARAPGRVLAGHRHAELASDNPLHFTVNVDERTLVPLRFRTNIGEIDLTQGYDIVLDVEEVAVRGVVVSNFRAQGSRAGVAVFAPNANGETPPLRTIGGVGTDLGMAAGVVVAGDDIIVAEQFAPAINVFPRDADGAPSPTRRIAGIGDDLVLPMSLAVYRGEMYVADELGTVLVFPLAATDEASLTRQITGLDPALQIAIDHDTGELYEPERVGGIVQVFPPGAQGAATPSRTLGGPATGLRAPAGVAVFGGGLFISDAFTGDIRVFSIRATGDTAPLQVISPVSPGSRSLGQLSVSRDEIYVVNNITGTVDVFPINATGAVAPTRSFAGPTLDGVPFQAFGVAVY